MCLITMEFILRAPFIDFMLGQTKHLYRIFEHADDLAGVYAVMVISP